jgi:transcriptional regulator with XRE-family HTH domain
MKTVDVLLEEQNLSIEELADNCGLAAERVLAIVDGRWLASPAERQRIAAALGRSIEQISWGHTLNPRNGRYHRFGQKEDFNQG